MRIDKLIRGYEMTHQMFNVLSTSDFDLLVQDSHDMWLDYVDDFAADNKTTVSGICRTGRPILFDSILMELIGRDHFANVDPKRLVERLSHVYGIIFEFEGDPNKFGAALLVAASGVRVSECITEIKHAPDGNGVECLFVGVKVFCHLIERGSLLKYLRENGQYGMDGYTRALWLDVTSGDFAKVREDLEIADPGLGNFLDEHVGDVGDYRFGDKTFGILFTNDTDLQSTIANIKGSDTERFATQSFH